MSQRRLVKIASGCKTEDQFVAVFNRFCDGQSIFIATRTPKPVGETLQFCVTLADGKPLLAGTGSVSESYSDKSGPFSRPGMRITFGELNDESTPMLTRLTEARGRPKPAKRPRPPVVGVPPILPRKSTPESKPKASAADAKPESSKSTKTDFSDDKTRGLPPPVLSGRSVTKKSKAAPPPPNAVDESWEDDTTDVVSPPPTPSARSRRALGSESEGSESSARSTSATEPGVPAPVDAAPTEPVSGLKPSLGPNVAPLAGDDDAEYDADDNHPDDRTPGSGFILPANPFGELESESLEHFIECTIYEEPTSSEAAGEIDDKGVVFANPFTDRDDDEDDDNDAAHRTGRVVTGEVEVPPLAEPDPIIAPPRPSPPPVAAPPPPPHAVAAPAVADPRPAPPLAGPATLPIVWLGVGVGVALVIGLVVGYLLWGSAATAFVPPDAIPVVVASNTTTNTTTAGTNAVAGIDAGAAVDVADAAPADVDVDAVADAAPAAVVADAAVEVAADAAPAIADPPVASGDCSIDVSTDPEGSAVLVGGKKLGETPGFFPVPCGEVAVTIDHPRYEAKTKNVTTTPGTAAAVRGRLERPRVKLTVRTRPSGARVLVGGRRVGVSPVTITVVGYERHRVTATKPGYRPSTRRIYPKRHTGVTMTLTRSSKRTPRRR